MNTCKRYVSYFSRWFNNKDDSLSNDNEIDHVSKIPKPTTFNSDVFPIQVRKHIDDYSLSSLTYTFQLLERTITIHFLIEDDNPEMHIKKYNTSIFLSSFIKNDLAFNDSI